MFWKDKTHGKHETRHARQRAQERGVCKKDRIGVIRNPDVVIHKGNKREHYRKSESRAGLYIKSVIAVGSGSGGAYVAALAGAGSIFGVGLGIAAAIVTYHYLSASKVPQVSEEGKRKVS